jgi:ribosome-binding factor A
MAYRQEKILELLKHLASQFLELESNGSSLVTVTDAKVSDDYKTATIFFTVFPDNKEKAVLDFVKRKRTEFKHFVKTESKLGRIPFFDFAIDEGEKNRQKIDEISQKL